MTNNELQIRVNLNRDTDPDNQVTPYSAIVLQWGDGPTMIRNAKGEEEILSGTEHGGWFNTGIVVWGSTPEEAFATALMRSQKMGKTIGFSDK